MNKIDTNELKAALEQFSGTEKYYFNPLFPEHRYTDGIKYLAMEAGAYWLIDFIFSYCEVPALDGEEFQVWKLMVNADESASIKVEDGNSNQLKEFRIPFTDFPLPQIELWLVDQVLILPSEY
jgi:hypothetical protein